MLYNQQQLDSGYNRIIAENCNVTQMIVTQNYKQSNLAIMDLTGCSLQS